MALSDSDDVVGKAMEMNGVLLITGANGGLGAAIADYLIGVGMRQIACHYRSASDRVSEVLTRHGLPLEKHLFRGELTREDEVSRVHLEIEERLGSVDKLVNLAGSSSNAMSWKMSLKNFEGTLGDNMTTTFLTCKEFAPGMRRMGHGRIINTSSIVAFRGTIGASGYAAAKGAIVGYSKSLALELAPNGITVNTLALGYFSAGIIEQVPESMRSELVAATPIGRLGEPAEVARCIEYLFSPQSQYVTGQTLHINGGLY